MEINTIFFYYAFAPFLISQSFLLQRYTSNRSMRLDPYLKVSFAQTRITAVCKEITFKVMKELSGVHEKMRRYKKALQYIKENPEKQKEFLNGEMNNGFKNFQVLRQTENAKMVAEVYKLKNVELAKALRDIENRNEDLKKLDSEKNDLFGIVAHDLRSPISSLIMLGDAIKDTLSSDKVNKNEIIEHARDIEITSKRTLDILTNLLDLNSFECGKFKINPKKIVADEIVKRVVETQKGYALSKKIELIISINSGPYYIIADESAAEQAITNIVNNAIKYSPYNKEIFISYKHEKNKILCSVKDNGPGISKKDCEKLFTKFAKLNNKPTGGEIATGLGLYIVKKLMEKMNGEVTCESTEGKGAEFILEFPSIAT